MTDVTDPVLRRVFADLARTAPELFAALNPRQPSYRYFIYRQHKFCWTTERMGDGTYHAFEYRPIGPGSRIGKAKRWKLVRTVKFKQRSRAKARAFKWYRALIHRYEG
jgi:hypothetical protein